MPPAHHVRVAFTRRKHEAAATAFVLSIGSQGNTRTQTMRAFSSDEMSAILAKMP
jgi:uncharacterized protein with GYD domain